MRVGIYHSGGREFFRSSKAFDEHIKSLPKESVLVCKKGDILIYDKDGYKHNGKAIGSPVYITARQGVRMATFVKYIGPSEFVKETKFF